MDTEGSCHHTEAQRHHLREFGVRTAQNPRELFNLRHSSLRVIVERTWVVEE
jgi:hypothetical protein